MKVTWKLPDGADLTADVDAGISLMEAAVANNVPGIPGECGGNMSCATCHVYVDEGWAGKTGEAGEIEDAMLDVTEAERRKNSRLSCQFVVSGDLDGLVLVVPQP